MNDLFNVLAEKELQKEFAMSTLTINIQEAQNQLQYLLSLALGGAEVIFTKDDKPVVRLMPVREEDAPLPESASFDEAVELFLADACSLSRAAELAGVTRWDIIGRLKERGIKIPIKMHRTAAEIDALAEELDRQGIL